MWNANRKANEELDGSNDHIKASDLKNKNGISHSNLIRPIAKLLVPENKSQFRSYGDSGSDDWNDFVMNGKKLQHTMTS